MEVVVDLLSPAVASVDSTGELVTILNYGGTLFAALVFASGGRKLIGKLPPFRRKSVSPKPSRENATPSIPTFHLDVACQSETATELTSPPYIVSLQASELLVVGVSSSGEGLSEFFVALQTVSRTGSTVLPFILLPSKAEDLSVATLSGDDVVVAPVIDMGQGKRGTPSISIVPAPKRGDDIRTFDVQSVFGYVPEEVVVRAAPSYNSETFLLLESGSLWCCLVTWNSDDDWLPCFGCWDLKAIENRKGDRELNDLEAKGDAKPMVDFVALPSFAQFECDDADDTSAVAIVLRVGGALRVCLLSVFDHETEPLARFRYLTTNEDAIPENELVLLTLKEKEFHVCVYLRERGETRTFDIKTLSQVESDRGRKFSSPFGDLTSLTMNKGTTCSVHFKSTPSNALTPPSNAFSRAPSIGKYKRKQTKKVLPLAGKLFSECDRRNSDTLSFRESGRIYFMRDVEATVRIAFTSLPSARRFALVGPYLPCESKLTVIIYAISNTTKQESLERTFMYEHAADVHEVFMTCSDLIVLTCDGLLRRTDCSDVRRSEWKQYPSVDTKDLGLRSARYLAQVGERLLICDSVSPARFQLLNLKSGDALPEAVELECEGSLWGFKVTEDSLWTVDMNGFLRRIDLNTLETAGTWDLGTALRMGAGISCFRWPMALEILAEGRGIIWSWDAPHPREKSLVIFLDITKILPRIVYVKNDSFGCRTVGSQTFLIEDKSDGTVIRTMSPLDGLTIASHELNSRCSRVVCDSSGKAVMLSERFQWLDTLYEIPTW